MNNLLEQLSAFWCQTMHPSPMWPIHGFYQCRACHRRFPVEWEAKTHSDSPVTAAVTLTQAFAREGR